MSKFMFTTASLWNDHLDRMVCPSLNEDIETEVCVIGGGMAGLSIAYQLLSDGKKVVILESKKIGKGETGRTSAHLSNALDDRYYNIEKMHGKKKSKLAAKSHTEAINWIEDVIKKEQIDCDFKRIPGYLFTNKSSKKILYKEQQAAKRAGITVTEDEQSYIGQCIHFPDQARFHPGKYLQGLAKAIVKLGGKIYEKSSVIKIDFDSSVIILENQHKVRAKNIVTATNAPLFSNLIMHSKLNPQRTYVIGFVIPKGSLKDALYWDNDNPYHYIRLENQDDKSDILIVGGEDHRVGTLPKENPFLNLQQWTQEKVQLNIAPIAYQWSGQILEPVDYMAYIGRHPKSKNIFMVTGDSGNGLTHGTLAAIIIADLIIKGKSSYEELYNSQRRLPYRAIKNWLSNIIASMWGYTKYLIPQWNKMPTAGSGKIVQRGFKKIAVYQDAEHKFHQCSGICRHLNAVLQWNSIEKTWDCPAHGSRFDLNGKFLNGPTHENLPCSRQLNK